MNRIALWLVVALLGGCAGAPDPRPALYGESERVLRRGVDAYADHDYADAMKLFRQALASYRSVDDRGGLLRTNTNLAETALALGRYEVAAGYLDRAEALAAEIGARDMARRLELVGASLALKRGRLEEAQQRLETFLAADEPRGPLYLSALADRILLALHRREDPRPWLQRYRGAIEADTPPLARARLDRLEGETLRASGQFAAARESLERALAGYKDVHYRPGIAAALEGLGLTYRSEGDRVAARDYLERALFIRVWVLDRAGTARLLHVLEQVVAEAGDVAATERYRALREAVTAPGFEDWAALQGLFD